MSLIAPIGVRDRHCWLRLRRHHFGRWNRTGRVPVRWCVECGRRQWGATHGGYG